MRKESDVPSNLQKSPYRPPDLPPELLRLLRVLAASREEQLPSFLDPRAAQALKIARKVLGVLEIEERGLAGRMKKHDPAQILRQLRESQFAEAGVFEMNGLPENRRAKTDAGLRRVVAVVMVLNLAYFGVEFIVAITIGSASLFADSADFFEDAAVNFLTFIALAWSAVKRARVGMSLAGILLLPALAFLWALWSKINAPIPPAPVPLSVTGLGALAINLTCAFMLARYRSHSGSITRAAFLSARNDACANIAIIGARLVTALHPSIWPDVIVGLGIAYMNVDAAEEVWNAARSEHEASG